MVKHPEVSPETPDDVPFAQFIRTLVGDSRPEPSLGWQYRRFEIPEADIAQAHQVLEQSLLGAYLPKMGEQISDGEKDAKLAHEAIVIDSLPTDIKLHAELEPVQTGNRRGTTEETVSLKVFYPDYDYDYGSPHPFGCSYEFHMRAGSQYVTRNVFLKRYQRINGNELSESSYIKLTPEETEEFIALWKHLARVE